MSKRFPFPVPYGWFAVAHSDELPASTLKRLNYFGRELLLYRGESGVAATVDSYCPHLGAHLGRGRVVGDHIVCPFHAWEFTGEGRLAKIPYCEQMPGRAEKEAPLRAYATVERNNMLYVWYHPHGELPAWDVEALPQAGEGDWAQARRQEWVVKTIPQELMENVADPIHFLYVHGTKTLPDATIRYEGRNYYSRQNADMQTPKGIVPGSIEIQGTGPVGGWTLFSGICDTFLMSFTTPIDEDHTHMRFVFYKKKVKGEIPKGGVADAIIADIIKQFEEDTPIWEEKRYWAQPMVCAKDGPINKFRRWYSQFYPNASPENASPENKAG